MATPAKVLIKMINKRWPDARATCTSEWNGRAGGIWFRGSEEAEIDGRRMFNYWAMDGVMVAPALEALLTEKGWYWEPQDAGTLMAYKV